MPNPWTDGLQELIQHAMDHLALGGDFDRRIAMISIDNSVELMIKTYLGLPERARGFKGPSRKELKTASESFPGLLDLLQNYATHKITGLSLDDIEWYHRLRNQLYHSGNGFTVDVSKVETYLQLAISLFENLFGFLPSINRASATHTKAGQFLDLWNKFEHGLRKQLPPKEGLAYYWKREYMRKVDPHAVDLYNTVSQFRNELVHGLESPTPSTIDKLIADLRKLMTMLNIEGD
jgi:hypothetical protein